MEVDKKRVAELVVKVQSGDNSAFNELYELTSKPAYFIALEFTKNEHDAEDILQESYIKALSKINEIDKPESFVSWFNQIVANKSKDHLKRKTPSLFEADENEAFEVIPDEDVDFRPEDSVDKTELQRTVMEVLDELKEEKRACIMLMYFEEMSVGEISDTLEIPEGTVKTRLFSARKDLKELFAKRGVTSLYSAAPVSVVVWAMRLASEGIQKSFGESPAYAKILAGATAASASAAAGAAVTGGTAAVTAASAVETGTAIGAAAETAAAATAAAAGTGAAASAAATGAGIAAKIAALSVVQKVVVGIAIVGVVGGSAAGGAVILKNSVQKETEPEISTNEEFNVDYTLTNGLTAVPAIAGTETSQETLTTTQSLTTVSATAKTEPVGTVRAVETTKGLETQPTTQKPKRTKPSTTRRDYSLNSTKATTLPTTNPSTTVRATSTTKVTETTTEKPTTVKQTETAKATTAAPATIIIKVLNLDNSVADTLTYSVPAGTEMTNDYLWDLVEAEGYTIDGVFGSSKGSTAESGQTYTFEADIFSA